MMHSCPGAAPFLRLFVLVLLAPSVALAEGREDLEARARLAVARDGRDMRVQRSIAFGGEGIVRFEQRVGGLRVVGSALSVRLRGDGSVAYTVTSGLVPAAARLTLTPSLDAALVLGIANRALGLTRPGRVSRVLVASGGALRSAYEVRLFRDGASSGHVVYVAESGRVLAARETDVSLDDARVYLENPVKTPTLVTTTLPVAPGSMALEGLFDAFSCVDDGRCTPIASAPSTLRYQCVPSARALRDGAGDFLFDPPLDHTDPEDPFAEVQAYYHVTSALDFFRAVALDEALTLAPMLAIHANILVPDEDDANLCGASTTPPANARLVPLDNAFYSPGSGDASDPPLLGFGQGRTVDFAYDGDVVRHEVAHAVQGRIAEIGSFYFPDDLGLRGDHGALTEGYADFWAAAMTEDPELAEYVGGGVGSALPSSALRSLANTSTCPESLVGEAHADGEIWGAALWEIRSGVPVASREAFDRALYVAFSTLAEATTFAAAADAVQSELAITLGEPTRALAANVFITRGLRSEACARRVRTVPPNAESGLVFLPSSLYGGGRAPMALQFAVTLGERAKTLGVTARRVRVAARHLEQGAPQATLLVKCGGEPIAFGWGETLTHDADASVPFTFTGNVETAASATAVAEGRFRPGTCHVAIVNEHPQFFLFADVAVQIDGGAFAPPSDGGCGCRAMPTRARSPFALFAAACLLAAWRVRRSAGRAR